MEESPGSRPSPAPFATVRRDWALALTKQKVAGKMNLLRKTALVPEWRNWQTRQVQDLVLAREWRVESSFWHHHPWSSPLAATANSAPSKATTFSPLLCPNGAGTSPRAAFLPLLQKKTNEYCR